MNRFLAINMIKEDPEFDALSDLVSMIKEDDDEKEKVVRLHKPDKTKNKAETNNSSIITSDSEIQDLHEKSKMLQKVLKVRPITQKQTLSERIAEKRKHMTHLSKHRFATHSKKKKRMANRTSSLQSQQINIVPSTFLVDKKVSSAQSRQLQHSSSLLNISSRSISTKPKKKQENKGHKNDTFGNNAVRLDKFAEKYSGIRIKNRDIDSIHLDEKMKDCKIIKIPQLTKYIANPPAGNWVIVGVISKKSDPRNTKTGGKYLIFTLFDMQESTISVFVFGQAYQSYWKQAEGVLVFIANPKVLPQKDKKLEIAISISSHHQMLILGKSMDFGYCKAYRGGNRPQSGKIANMERCRNAINTSKFEFCRYHDGSIITKQVNSPMRKFNHKVNSPLRKFNHIPNKSRSFGFHPVKRLTQKGIVTSSAAIHGLLPSRREKNE